MDHRTKATLAAAILTASACAAPQPISGAYRAADRQQAEVQAAEAVALDAIYKHRPTRALVDSVTAEIQVVAGFNYRFRVEMTGAPDYRDIYEVIVYEDLDGTFTVTKLEQLQGELNG